METMHPFYQTHLPVSTAPPAHIGHYAHNPPAQGHAGMAETPYHTEEHYKQSLQLGAHQHQYPTAYVSPNIPGPFPPPTDPFYHHHHHQYSANFPGPTDPAMLYYSQNQFPQSQNSMPLQFLPHPPSNATYTYGNYAPFSHPSHRTGLPMKTPPVTLPPSSVPKLEFRRSSSSSATSAGSPRTPVLATTSETPSPFIAGESNCDKSPNCPCIDIRPVGPTLTPYKPNPPQSFSRVPPSFGRRFMARNFPRNPKSPMSGKYQNPLNTNNVYIRGLPPDMNDEKLYDITSKFGCVISSKAIMDLESGLCKGFGFAKFETLEGANECMHTLTAQNYEVGKAKDSFNSRLKSLGDPASTNVYVSNLPLSMGEKDLAEVFVGYKVVSTKILRNVNGESRGVGFASFENHDICDQVIKEFHGKVIGQDIEKLTLHVRYADTNAQKRFKAMSPRSHAGGPGTNKVGGSGSPSYKASPAGPQGEKPAAAWDINGSGRSVPPHPHDERKGTSEQLDYADRSDKICDDEDQLNGIEPEETPAISSPAAGGDHSHAGEVTAKATSEDLSTMQDSETHCPINEPHHVAAHV